MSLKNSLIITCFMGIWLSTSLAQTKSPKANATSTYAQFLGTTKLMNELTPVAATAE